MAAQQLGTATKSEASLTIENDELTRFLKLVMAKGDTGFPFTVVGLRLKDKTVTAEYRSPAGTSAIVATFPAVNTTEGAIATNDPERLLKYLGTFDGKDELTVTRAGDRIVVSVNGGKSISVGSINDADVPRQTLPDPYGPGPKGLVVNSATARRPNVSPTTPEAWAAAGYTVVEVPKDQVESILRSGKLVHSYYKNAVVTFDFRTGGFDTTVRDPSDPSSDTYLTGFDNTSVVGAFGDTATVRLRYDVLEPLWTALDNLDWDSLTFIHHPEEARVNFLVREGGMAESAGVTFIAAVWKAPE